jgi:hypothetical protein
MALFSPAAHDAPHPRPTDTIDANPYVNLSNFTLQDLLKLRAEIEQKLPARSLKDIDLERELVLQWMASQELQNRILQDQETPANQKAQVANSTATILQQLGKLQIEIHSSERLKKIEAILIETLQTLPTEAQEAFFVAYAEALEGD